MKKKNYNLLFISIPLFIIGIIILVLYIYLNAPFNSIYLNDAIKNDNTTDIYANLKIVNPPYSFAKVTGEENKGYYIVYDNSYFYIAYMSDNVYHKLADASTTNTKTIYGVTKPTNETVKNLAIKVYNDSQMGNTITEADFNNYFGSIYLDVIDSKNNILYLMLSLIFFTSSLACITYYFIKNFNKNRK